MTEQTRVPLGRRIAMRGVTGSGKSTLARGLGEALGLPVIELDAIHWRQPNWQPLPREEFRRSVSEALAAAPQGWIVEGNYSAVADLYLAEADTLIWINLPWRVSFGRVVKRTYARVVDRKLLWGAQRESFWTQLLDPRNSIIWWSVHHHRQSVRQTRQFMEEMTHLQRIELRSAREVEALLERARQAAASRQS